MRKKINLVPVFFVLAGAMVCVPAEGGKKKKKGKETSSASKVNTFGGTKARLLTPWGEKVNGENAWREYPRPQLAREDWLCLNGHWDYAVLGEGGNWTGKRVMNAEFDPFVKGTAKQPEKWDGKILVPYPIESTLSGVQQLLRPLQTLWYQREFEVPASWGNRPVRINFGAVDWHAVVFVNGKQVGEHRGGYTPFSFDITDALAESGSQKITVGVWDPTNVGGQSIGKQALPELAKGFRYEPTSGIWQTVWLEPVAEQFIEKLKITPQKNLSSVLIRTEANQVAGLDVQIRILKDGKVVAEKTGAPGSDLLMDVKNAELWTPENPFLYDVEVSLVKGGKELDQVSSYFGMRTVGLKKDKDGISRMTLNGEFIYQYGPLDQGYWPDSGILPTTDEAARYDVQYLKDISCNMVRVHMKVHPSRWYYWCDKLGLLVWQDFVCSRKFDQQLTGSNNVQWEFEQKEMVDEFYNHPSIVMWIVFNEGWGQYNTRQLTEEYMEYDPSRVISSASGGTHVGAGQVYDNHDYGFFPSPGWAQKLPDQLCIVGECGGFNVVVPGHIWYAGSKKPSDKFNYAKEGSRPTYSNGEKWLAHYTEWIKGLRGLNYYGSPAAVYTQITDVEHELNGWLTYDRKVKKIPDAELSKVHRTLYRMPTVVNLLEGGSVKMAKSQVGDAWTAVGFDDASWKPLPVPPLVPKDGESVGASVLRFSFNLDALPETPAIRTVGLGGYQVFVNGKLAIQFSNSTKINRKKTGPFEKDPVLVLPGISVVPLPPDACALLKTGKNVVAIKYSGKALYDAAVIDIRD